ncbi:MFS transporter [Variovorax terrae]|uniref:MFS transporter n=1 Tax=Variovorax terrae TaxID=2923278 RepID=A0A9X1VVK1_9BURK|nr:MFS transporter [Variovorax terrae]MCJ0764596.1 MFS transporter [Variovorax terrae]
MNFLPRRTALVLFLAFAIAYFFSALLRGITATLAPVLTADFALNSRDLGLLAGGYFLGFAIMQLPLGQWLDRHGPKKVLVYFAGAAVLGCVAFSLATGFAELLAARVLCGVGVSACLMAPLTAFRRWLEPMQQLRANSWMLMTGSLGMVAATLPVQWLMPVVGWRPLFWGLALLIALSSLLIAWQVPAWGAVEAGEEADAPRAGYADVWRHPYFRRMMPIGFFNYGGMVAMQTLWAGPWMIQVTGNTPLQAATGLFFINVAMLCTFWSWGMLTPWLMRRRLLQVDRLIAWGLPLSFAVLAMIIVAGEKAGAGAWAVFCVSCTFVSLAQPAVGMAFPAPLAGRALSAYNLVLFAGVFMVQWGIGLAVDAFAAAGLSTVGAFQAAMSVFLVLSMASYAWFLLARSHNQAAHAPS